MIDVLNYLDATADRAGARHTLIVGAMLANSKSAMSGFDAFSANAARQLSGQLHSVGRFHLGEEQDNAEREIAELSKNARTVAQSHLGMSELKIDEVALSEQYSASENVSLNFLTSEIATQINRDANQVLRDYRNAALRVVMKADSEGIPRSAAALDVMIDEAGGRNRLWFVDRAGRRIPSQKHVRRLWRQVLRDHWVQVYMQTLAHYGEATALIWHSDVSHRAYGKEISVSAMNWGLPNLEDVFHPNSRALPVARAYMKEIA